MPLKEIFNWIFPQKCLICNCEIVENSIFCPECFSNITIIDYPFCKICGKIIENSFGEELICNTCVKRKRYFEKTRSLFKYDKFSRQLVMKIKRESDSFVAKSCCEMLFSKYRDIFQQADFIVPVPSHWIRLIKRGFNPADIISSKLSLISGVPVKKFLKRIKQTQYQKNKSFQERVENVLNAFDCFDDLNGRKIIIVDDVMTTGATLDECSKTLKNHGCEKVFCITICST